MSAAALQHQGQAATLKANAPRPLMQAVEGISEEYGWIVDFEDPLYRSQFDLADSTDPGWRASHPTEKGALRVSGGLFESNFPEPSSIPDANAEERVLEKLIADYNSSGNPGKFAVRKQADGRYAVVGVARKDDIGKDEVVSALLDTAISFPVQRRDAKATLNLIVHTLTANTGVKVYLGTIGLSSDPLQEAELAIGGTNVPARTLLLQALEGISTTSPHFAAFWYGTSFSTRTAMPIGCAFGQPRGPRQTVTERRSSSHSPSWSVNRRRNSGTDGTFPHAVGTSYSGCISP